MCVTVCVFGGKQEILVRERSVKVPEVPAWTPGSHQRKHGGVPGDICAVAAAPTLHLLMRRTRRRLRPERRPAIHMLMAGDACPIRSTHMLKVNAAFVLHSGTIDARFQQRPEQRNTTRVRTNH